MLVGTSLAMSAGDDWFGQSMAKMRIRIGLEETKKLFEREKVLYYTNKDKSLKTGQI